MRARTIGASVVTAVLALTFGLAGSAGATAKSASTAAKTTGAEHFEVYATNFEASYAPVYLTGVITTVGTGYKDFAEGQDQVYAPNVGGNVGGTFVIDHPGLTQTQGVTTTFDPTTCVTTITGSGPVHFIDGTGIFKKVRGTGVVDLNIRVFQRVNADGSCNSDDPPIGYIEIAMGNLQVTTNS
ncbi:MAG TPA: hypothetical protein VGJ28_02680 [Micromonosporaceae bacterium]